VTNHDLSLEISAIRDMTTRVGRGTYDDCDPDLVTRLRQVASELYEATRITDLVTKQ
jgi:hypothetical protein